jgi:hypothetical protein
MAKVLGASGRYVSDEALRQRKRFVLFCVLTVEMLSVAEGVIISGFLPTGWHTGLGRLAVALVVLFVMLTLTRWGLRKGDEIERKGDHMARGATGEILVGQLLAKFPREFCIINDVATPQGNLDHVVIGPTGVYILDTKAWRGVVAADGRGELLVNGRPTGKPFVRLCMYRMMGIRNRLLVLAPGMDIHFNVVFVFTAAWVEARWGTTKSVDCVRDDQLYDYIVDNRFRQKLSPEEIVRITEAFLSLARLARESGRPVADHATAGQIIPYAGRDKDRAVRPAAMGAGQES